MGFSGAYLCVHPSLNPPPVRASLSLRLSPKTLKTKIDGKPVFLAVQWPLTISGSSGCLPALSPLHGPENRKVHRIERTGTASPGLPVEAPPFGSAPTTASGRLSVRKSKRPGRQPSPFSRLIFLNADHHTKTGKWRNGVIPHSSDDKVILRALKAIFVGHKFRACCESGTTNH